MSAKSAIEAMSQLSKIMGAVGVQWPAHFARVPPPCPIPERLAAYGIAETRLLLEQTASGLWCIAAYRMQAEVAVCEPKSLSESDPHGLSTEEQRARGLLRFLLLEWLMRGLNKPEKTRPAILDEITLADEAVWALGESNPARRRHRVIAHQSWVEPPGYGGERQRATLITWNNAQDPTGPLILVPTSALEWLH